MIVAGIGFRSNALVASLAEVLATALRDCSFDVKAPDALATAADKASEPALKDLAAHLGVPIVAVESREMQRVAHLAATRSERVLQTRGVPSVAETCALAAAGRDARLICARVANATATCALAEGEGP